MTQTPAIAGLAVSVLLLAACSAPPVAQPTPDLEQTVQARVSATLATQPTSAPIGAAGDLAQSRSGQPLSVWADAGGAYLAQFPALAQASAQRCTVAPYANVRVVQRDVGFRLATLGPAAMESVRTSSYTGPSSEQIAQIASFDGRCVGYVAETLITGP